MGNLTESGFNRPAPLPAYINPNSAWCGIHRTQGSLGVVSKSIAGTGAEVITNLWTITGTIELIDLWAVFTDVSNVVTCSGIWWDLWDGANSVALTLDGANCNGVSVGTTIIKTQTSGNVADVQNASQVRFQESANNNPRIFLGGMMQYKSGATNYVRLRMDTDGNTDVTLSLYMAWACHHTGSSVVAA